MFDARVSTAVLAPIGRLLPRGRGGVAAVAIAASLWLVSALPVGEWLYEALSNRFPPFAPDDKPVAGIIVLGNSSWSVARTGQLIPPPHETEDRRLDALELARRYPTARVVASGGPVDPQTNVADADLVGRYFIAQGVAPERMILERRSTNTYENAAFSYPLAKPRPGERWLLVTSPWHMPRAMGAFRHAGFTVVAAPAARRDGYYTRRFPTAASRSTHERIAWKELGGLLIYNIEGRTSAIFPAP